MEGVPDQDLTRIYSKRFKVTKWGQIKVNSGYKESFNSETIDWIICAPVDLLRCHGGIMKHT